MSASAPIAVVGAGAWGTALAQMLAQDGRDVTIFARDAATAIGINERRENPLYLPGVALDRGISATSDLSSALSGATCALIAVPAQTLRQVAVGLARQIYPGLPLVLCAKGIEQDTGRFPSEIVAEACPQSPTAVLSGPSFAMDVARGLPTAVTIAARDEGLARRLAALLSTRTFRCYSTSDVAGVEVGAALKNVLAIAAGAVAGAGLGASAQAAIVTRGFVELRRIGAAFGAKPETLMGLSGLGDLMLTCNSSQSRNFSYGLALGRGETVQGRLLAEGVATAGVAARLATERGVDAPIIAAVNHILSRSLTIGEAIAALLSRPLKQEDN